MKSDIYVWIGGPIVLFLGGIVYKRLPARWRVRIRRWAPSPGTIFLGLFIALYGLLTTTGATFTVQVTGAEEPAISEIPKFSQPFVSWVLVALGFDFMFTKGRLIPWLLARLLAPVNSALSPVATAIKESDIGLYIKQRLEERRQQKEDTAL